MGRGASREGCPSPTVMPHSEPSGEGCFSTGNGRGREPMAISLPYTDQGHSGASSSPGASRAEQGSLYFVPQLGSPALRKPVVCCLSGQLPCYRCVRIQLRLELECGDREGVQEPRLDCLVHRVHFLERLVASETRVASRNLRVLQILPLSNT